MNLYDERARIELEAWKRKMKKGPSLIDQITKGTQDKLNALLPRQYHEVIAGAIKNMIKLVLVGAEFTTRAPYEALTLRQRDDLLREKTKTYSRVAMLEGAGTGAGGILLGLADFPLLLTIKMKYLYEVAAIYGFDADDYKERLYILHIFELAFSSKGKMREVIMKMENWEQYAKSLPSDLNAFDWRAFQQEYRDYIDLAKLLQLVPGIGAVVGAYVNTNLMKRLSITAMRSYHMRLMKGEG